MSALLVVVVNKRKRKKKKVYPFMTNRHKEAGLMVASSSVGGLSTKVGGVLPLGGIVLGDAPLHGAEEQNKTWKGVDEEAGVPADAVGEASRHPALEGL